MKTLIFFLLLPISSTAGTMDPPAIEWERLFESYTEAFDVCEANEGYIIGLSDALGFANAQGYLQWVLSPSDVNWHYLKCQAILHLEGEGYVSTGVGKITQESSYSIFLLKVDYDGNPLWIKNYDDPESTDYAYDVISLPDNGFAIAARHGWDSWVLRTDSQGDTLWTREWGTEYNDRAMSVLYIENGLTVLMHGSTSSTPGGPHLVRYDMAGDMLWETDIPILSGKYAQTMCEASDNGLLIMNYDNPLIVHTDYEGNTDWYFAPPSVGQSFGWSIDTTMDGGIIYGGGCDYDPPIDDICAMISRHDVNGDELWRDYVYNSNCTDIYSIRQLSQGGYIAAGKAFPNPSPNPYQAILIKYSPETGISQPDPVISPGLGISPNPFSSTLSVNFSLPEPGTASLHIYDLSGRRVDVVADEVFPAGKNTVEWVVPNGVSSGCYLIQYKSTLESISERCMLIN